MTRDELNNYYDTLNFFINNHTSDKDSVNLKMIKIFNTIQNMPWKYIDSRNPINVIKKNAGTCSGKHILLRDIYQLLNINVKECIVAHRFSDLPITLPLFLRDWLLKNTFLDFHIFLKIEILGKWVIIDATWDPPLYTLNFPITINWDGKRNTLLGVKPIEIFEVKDSIKFKEEKISKMSKEEIDNRLFFIKELSEYLNAFRIKNQHKL